MDLLLAATTLLAIGFILSKIAVRHWIFDLFTHFTLQYALTAAALFILLASNKDWITSILAVIIATGCFRTVIRFRRQHTGNPVLKIAQYNKLYSNRAYSVMGDWLKNADADMLLIEEGLKGEEALWSELRRVYPYQFPATGDMKEETLIFSRTPFVQSERFDLGSGLGHVLRVTTSPEKLADPVTLFAAHTPVPFGKKPSQDRNAKLLALADAVNKDNSVYKIAVGDLNITPYSPHFQSFLRLPASLTAIRPYGPQGHGQVLHCSPSCGFRWIIS